MKTTGAQLITRLIERQGVDIIAGIPGGANLPLYDALHSSHIRHVLARHEQGAGFIAQGMARATGQPAVCFGTSGPGATNLLTAIADAKLDSIPLVAITGQVPRAMIGTDAFQEIDTYGLTIPITKHNYLVRSATELLDVIPDAGHNPETETADREWRDFAREKVAQFAAKLEGKELEIFNARLRAEDPETLQDIGVRFGISRERVRQIETRLKRRLKEFIEATAPDVDDAGPS